MDWKQTALSSLQESLTPIPHELDRLDWKSGLSPKKDHLAKHLSAFANYSGGGFLAFGIRDDATFTPIDRDGIEKITRQVAQIAQYALSVSIQIDYAVLSYRNHPLLFIYVPEQENKPVHLRGQNYSESYIRNGGQTMRMTEEQVRRYMADAKGLPFEERIAMRKVSRTELLDCLDSRKFFDLLNKPMPSSPDAAADRMAEFGLCVKNDADWDITNLGALLFSTRLAQFNGLENRRVIVRHYVGDNNRELLDEHVGVLGYAVSFERLIDYIMAKVVQEEKIGVRREISYMYPKIAIREFVANALVHQDFAYSGIKLTVEIFSNRLVITNPGSPLNDINRLIDMPPNSRNEKLAQRMYELNFCEQRGSGIDRAIAAIEEMNLPAPKIRKEANYTQVTLFPHKNFQEMSKEERVEACYQHCCLLYESKQNMTNQSLRGRFKLQKSQISVASKIIADTMEAGRIKLADENATSKKFISYIPFYA